LYIVSELSVTNLTGLWGLLSLKLYFFTDSCIVHPTADRNG